MDDLTRSFYWMAFQLAFMEKKGDEFQDFFASIMEKRYSADFIRVRPWGNVGDQKNDGHLKSERVLFQCYAPNELTSARCIAKIDEDFNGALPHWREHFDTWVFVHNSKAGLGPEVTAKLLDLDQKHPDLSVTQWGYEELRQRVFSLDEPTLASLLGPVPSRQSMTELGLADLAPVLDQIARLPEVAEPDLRPVPADKLERNLLSDPVATLLRAGMHRAPLVRKYFAYNPRLQDQIAGSFGAEYQRLRAGSGTPDDIFMALQRYAGGASLSAPNHQTAVLACLAFFFEECDIFERPEPPEST